MFVSQFKDILDYVQHPERSGYGKCPTRLFVICERSVTREDEIEESVPTKEFLANAPQTKDDYVVIPRVHIEQ